MDEMLLERAMLEVELLRMYLGYESPLMTRSCERKSEGMTLRDKNAGADVIWM